MLRMLFCWFILAANRRLEDLQSKLTIGLQTASELSGDVYDKKTKSELRVLFSLFFSISLEAAGIRPEQCTNRPTPASKKVDE